jgi:serine/threonine-protein kinase
MTANQVRVSRGLIVNGQYRLEKMLGQGGMGTVWTARDLRLDRLVAIKFQSASVADDMPTYERFQREARIASRIRSPHVAQIISDGLTSDGVPFVVMELLDGESLAAHLARANRCTLAETGAILEQVCRALSSTHAAGLVHRDIKPANIFLTPQPTGDAFVRLLDFGIAKELWSDAMRLTLSGELLGTAEYMSPEQLGAPDQVGAATDIWSLGVVVYEMLTGQSPFGGRTLPEVAMNIASGKFRPLRELCPELPPGVDQVLARALSVQVNQRYAKPEHFATEFLRVVRAHTSTSMVKPDVLRALQQVNNEAKPRELAATVKLQAGRSRGRLVGVLLIAASVVSVAVAWQLTAAPTESSTPPEAVVAPVPVPKTPPPTAAAPISPAPAPPLAAPTETSSHALTSEERGIAPPRAATTKRKKHAGANAKPTADAPIPPLKQLEPQRPSAPTMKETEYGF